jgi:hypothetical protein
MCRTRPKLPERLSRYWPSIYPQGTAAPMALARGKLIELLGRQPTRRGAGLFSFTAASGTPTRTASLLLSRGPIRATGLTRLRGGGDGLIYTQVGLVTLMGLISKHGILIAEFANELQHAGRSKREAILEATAIRLRPILMTTAAMVLGVLPLIAANRRRRRVTLQFGSGDRLRAFDRHLVYTVRASRRLSRIRRGPFRPVGSELD